MFFRLLRKKDSFARKVVALLVLCGVLFATAPIPIGWKPKSTASSEPFPCQDCNCGCLTPEQCWTSCCCFTPEERLAWAVENGVEPPSYAVLVNKAALVKTERLAPISKAVVTKACRIGTCKHDAGVCVAVAETNSNSCSAPKQPTCKACKKLNEASATEVNATNEQDRSELIVVLSVSAMKCRGLSSDFNIPPWATLRTHLISCSFPEPIVTSFEVLDEWLPSSGSQPAEPPPRLTAHA